MLVRTAHFSYDNSEKAITVINWYFGFNIAWTYLTATLLAVTCSLCLIKSEFDGKQGTVHVYVRNEKCCFKHWI